MLYLLKIEWMKFKHFRVAQALILGFMILLPGILMVGKNVTSIPPEFGTTELFFIFPNVWNVLAYVGSWLAFFFLGFFGVISVTSEYSNKTLRQNIITGLTRRDVFIGKLGSILGISVLATAYYILVGLGIGMWHTETIYLSKVLQESGLFFRFFLMCLGYMTFGLLLGTVFRKTGLALFAYLAIVMFIEPVIRWAVHMRYFPDQSMHFYPMNALEDLTPIPFGEYASQFMKQNDFQPFLDPTVAITLSIGYFFLYIFLIYWRLQKMDL